MSEAGSKRRVWAAISGAGLVAASFIHSASARTVPVPGESAPPSPPGHGQAQTLAHGTLSQSDSPPEPTSIPSPSPTTTTTTTATTLGEGAEANGLGPITGRVFAYARAPLSDLANDRWQQVSSSIWLQAHPRFGEFTYAHMVGSVDTIATSSLIDEPVRGRVREAYVGAARHGWEARLGQQIVPWGNADGYNPTDLISSVDMRLFSGDSEVRRVGAPMLWASWTPRSGESPLQLTAVAVPVFTSSHVLVPPDLVPAGVIDHGLERPEAKPSSSEFAGKAAWHGDGWDASFMAFTGYNHTPHFVLRSWSPAGVVIARAHQRQHAVGGDGSVAWGSWVLRGETAWVWSSSSDGSDPQLAPPRWDSVLGVERPFLERFRFQTQMLWRYHPSLQSPASISTADPIETFLRREVASANAVLLNYRFRSWPVATVRVSFATRDEKLEAEVFAAVQLTRYEGDKIDWVMRPMVSWRVSDALRLRLGAESFRGPKDGVFGALHRFSGVFTEGEFAF